MQHICNRLLRKNRFAFLVTLLFLSYSHLAFAHRWSPHPGRYECPEIKNSFECAQMIEKKINTSFVHRINESVLEITLLDGEVRSFINVENATEGFQVNESIRYSVLEITNESRYVVLGRYFREGEAYALLDRKTGAYHELKGYPVFSPDGGKLLVASTDFSGFGYTVLQIYKVMEKTIEFEYSADLGGEWSADWGVDSIVWQSSSIIIFTRVTIDCSIYEKTACEKQFLKYGKSGWTISAIQ